MIETDTCRFAIELPQAWDFAPGKHWIMGWMLTKTGDVFTDIRCWVDGDLFLGLTGMPRPEIEKQFRGSEGLPHPGFLFQIEPRQGAQKLRIEVLTPGGAWIELWSTPITVQSGGEPPAVCALDPEWIPENLYSLLKSAADDPQVDIATQARRMASEAAARPLDTLPNPPFFGALEEPGPVVHTQYHKMILRGWLIHKEQRVRRVYATTHPLEECTIPYGMHRPDAMEFHPGHFTEGNCQFRGQVDLRAWAGNPVCVKVFAELEDGQAHLVFAKRMLQSTCDEKERHFPAFDPAFFLGCARTLKAAYEAAALALPPARRFWHMVWKAFRVYRIEAPTPTELASITAARNKAHPTPDGTVDGRGLHAVLLSHNLKFEGAPFFLLELADWLVKRAGMRVTILTGQDGPLREAFEETGAMIRLIDEESLYDCETRWEYGRRIRSLAREVDLHDADVVYANTAVCFWGVHLAHAAGKAALLQIHESASIKRFFDHSLTWQMHKRVRDAFRRAERVVFLAAATRRYYEDLSANGNFRLIPSWIDLPRIETFRAGHPRAALRSKHGFGPDDLVIANIGTVCERKGQHVFVRSIEHFVNTNPDYGRRARFLFVGGRPGLFQDNLIKQLEDFGLRDRVVIINETRAAYEYYGLADMFVCTSFEESFPRVILEAMAFELPIVSTDVHGIPEIVTHGREAWLCPPGDPVAFSNLMRRCLDRAAAGESLVPAALARVRSAFDLRVALPRHAAELVSVARAGRR